MFYKLLFVLLALGGRATSQTARRRFDVEIYNLTCVNKSVNVKHFKCEYLKLATSRYIFNLNAILHEDFGPESEAHLTIKITPPNSGTTVTFLDLKMNVCAGLKNIFKNPLLKGLMDEVRRSSNLPYSCPFKKNILYQIRNYTVTNEIVPAYSPYINFTCTLYVYLKQEFLGGGLVKGAVIPKSKRGV